MKKHLYSQSTEPRLVDDELPPGLTYEAALPGVHLLPRHQGALHLATQPQVQVGSDLVLVLDSE